jgi:phosphate transport system protein
MKWSKRYMTTRSVLDQDMLDIRDNILRLSSLVSQAVERAVVALKQHDMELAQAIVSDDIILDELHNNIEEHVQRTFALQQPMARDMRRLVADLLISNELERMGDHAEGTARTVLRYSGDTAITVPEVMFRMKDHVQRMLMEVMDAYVGMDAEKARAAAALDDQLDALYQELFNMVVPAMSSGTLSVEEGTYLLWAGHNMERIGDRVTNISERIVYAHSGDVEDFNPKRNEA